MTLKISGRVHVIDGIYADFEFYTDDIVDAMTKMHEAIFMRRIVVDAIERAD